MMNKKFLGIGAAVLGVVVLASAMNIGNANTGDVAQVKAPTVATVQLEEGNPHNFTNFNMVRSNPTDSTPVGSVKEISYKGKIIGEIKQLDGFKQVSSNLTPEETTAIYQDLKSEGKADSLTMNDSFKAGDSIYNNIVAELGGVKKTAISDVETVVLSTSIAFRSGNAAPTAAKEDVLKSIKATRAKFLEQNTYKPGLNKVTTG